MTYGIYVLVVAGEIGSLSLSTNPLALHTLDIAGLLTSSPALRMPAPANTGESVWRMEKLASAATDLLVRTPA